ncbi:MAG: hypothetical protein U9O56_06930 [Campylobacterota bacterium]|nr:hypothetical protein [Campylobacterota bacterium]
MTKGIEEFSCLFDFVPKIPILNLENNTSDITTALNELVVPYNGEITTLKTTKLNELKVKVKKETYLYGIVCDSLVDHEDKHRYMKIISTGIRDSGYIIILEKKDKNIDVIYQLLEEFDYAAVSLIDIFDDFHLIMAKKVHMWGMN